MESETASGQDNDGNLFSCDDDSYEDYYDDVDDEECVMVDAACEEAWEYPLLAKAEEPCMQMAGDEGIPIISYTTSGCSVNIDFDLTSSIKQKLNLPQDSNTLGVRISFASNPQAVADTTDPNGPVVTLRLIPDVEHVYETDTTTASTDGLGAAGSYPPTTGRMLQLGLDQLVTPAGPRDPWSSHGCHHLKPVLHLIKLDVQLAWIAAAATATAGMTQSTVSLSTSSTASASGSGTTSAPEPTVSSFDTPEAMQLGSAMGTAHAEVMKCAEKRVSGVHDSARVQELALPVDLQLVNQKQQAEDIATYTLQTACKVPSRYQGQRLCSVIKCIWHNLNQLEHRCYVCGVYNATSESSNDNALTAEHDAGSQPCAPRVCSKALCRHVASEGARTYGELLPWIRGHLQELEFLIALAKLASSCPSRRLIDRAPTFLMKEVDGKAEVDMLKLFEHLQLLPSIDSLQKATTEWAVQQQLGILPEDPVAQWRRLHKRPRTAAERLAVHDDEWDDAEGRQREDEEVARVIDLEKGQRCRACVQKLQTLE